jgi:hypothetical protein
MNLKTIGLLGGCLLAPLPLQAQTAGTAATTSASSGGAFQGLSTGNQKIADALFAAQTPTGTQVALTRDQIATMKQGDGWGSVFKQMKSDGLVSAKNLGQVVSAHEHALHSASSGATQSTAGGTARGSGSGAAGATQGGAMHGGTSSHTGTMRGGTASSGATRGATASVASHGYAAHVAAHGYGSYGGGWGGHAMSAAGSPYTGAYGHGGMGGGFGGGFAGGRFGGGGFGGGGHGR